MTDPENIRLHERIDDVAKDIVLIKVTLASISAKMPQQPCAKILDHLQAHERNENRAWQVAMKFVSPAALGAALVALWRAFSE